MHGQMMSKTINFPPEVEDFIYNLLATAINRAIENGTYAQTPPSRENRTFPWEQYPIALRPKHIEKIMKMSQRKTYEFLQNPPFHVAKVGRELYISRDVFRSWFEGTALDE